MSNIDFNTNFHIARRSLSTKSFTLTLENLGYAVGLSKQHLTNLSALEPKRKPSGGDKNKPRSYFLSYEKLKEVILFLSLYSLNETHIEFIKNKKNGTENSATYFSKFGYPEVKHLNLERLKLLLFSAIELLSYAEFFLATKKINNSKNEVDSFLELVDKNGKSYYEKKVEEINHSYQIWTLTDVLGESQFEDAAKKTAEYILKYKILYINFIPLSENNEWVIAKNNLEKKINSILSSSTYLKQYWDNDDWKKYWIVYGVSESSFLTRLRVYNVLSESPTGNYNVGGTTIENIELVNILPDEASAIKRKLSPIVKADKAGKLFTDKNTHIPELNCYANKKFPS